MLLGSSAVLKVCWGLYSLNFHIENKKKREFIYRGFKEYSKPVTRVPTGAHGKAKAMNLGVSATGDKFLQL